MRNVVSLSMKIFSVTYRIPASFAFFIMLRNNIMGLHSADGLEKREGMSAIDLDIAAVAKLSIRTTSNVHLEQTSWDSVLEGNKHSVL